MKMPLFPPRWIIALVLILLSVFSLSAKDFGILLDQTGSFESTGDDTELKYFGTLIPWFSTPFGESSDLYISAGVTVQYEFEKWKIVPELLRTELTLRMAENGEIRIGRMPYVDSLGFITKGLFDGVQYSRDLGVGGTLGIGAWYTGFLYKRNAHITMTEKELALYDSELKYDDFFNTYFAPRRLIVALDWEHPSLKEFIKLDVSFIGQFDLSGNDILYHSQYLAAKISLPVNSFVFEAGACIGLSEMSDRFQVMFAGELGVAWFLPTLINDRLSFTGRFSNGTLNDKVVAFVPVTTEFQGNVLLAKLSGLSMLSLDYTARLLKSLSVSISSSYFILSDLGTYQGSINGKEGHFLGNEFYGLLIWSPVSDLQIRGGGGVFLPSLGNADKSGNILWRIDLNAVLALF